MNWLHALRLRIRALRKKEVVEQELDDELRFHIEMQTEENLRLGMSPEEARRQAILRFGGVEGHREACRDARGLGWLEDAGRDVRYAWRTLVRAPGFALAAVLTLGLGIGATTAIFGVVDALFLRHPAGVRSAEEVVRLYIARDEGMVQNSQGGAGSFVDYRVIRDRVPGFSETAAFLYTQELDLNRGEQAQRVRGSVVSQTFLPLLGIQAERGRLFLPEEDSVIGTHPVAVISHGFWRRHFGADPAAVGQTLLLNGQLVTIVGVTQEGFTGIEPDPVDVWVPIAMAAPLGLVGGGSDDWREQPMTILVNVIGRLAPGTEPGAVAASATAALRHSAEEFPRLDPTPDVLTGTLVAAGGPTRSKASDLAIWLMAVTGIVLVIACANVANLLLSRAASRRQETAIRLSIGAGRWRLIRQHLTESLVISSIGGAVGLLLALWSTRLIAQFPLPPSATELSLRPLLFALALAVVTGFVFGLAPAFQAGRSDPVTGLKDSRTGTSPGGRRLRSSLIGIQVALSVVLLVGAGLFVRSLREVYAVDPGIDVDRLLLVSVDLRKAGYESTEREAFYAAARERALRIPGVEAAVMTHFAPFARMAYGAGVEVPGRDSLVFDDGPYLNLVAPGYFATMGTRMLRGREITDADRTGEPVAVINESFARLLSPGGDPMDTCIAIREQIRTGECTRVVGVVEGQRRQFLEENVSPFVYLSRDREPDVISWGGPTLVVRTRGDAGEVAGQLRDALQGLDPRLPFVAVEPLSAVIRPDLLPYRLGATLFTLFGILALALAAVGLYGVLGYFIAERRPEIGIRRAMGAQERNVMWLVIRQGMLPVVVGLVVGLTAAFAGARLLEALLFGVAARDPISFLVAALFLVGVALLASYVPARRAARVDPMVALRAD